jgi:2-polyprenyl-3-methyl-5-hydroxy-6-metoxy-1,4-benzoquinol methylase
MNETHNQPSEYFDNDREDMLKYIPQDIKTSLEYGCGYGGFSCLLKQRFNTESWAVEINQEAASVAMKKLDHVINHDAIESINDIPEHYFDCIILFDILEHLIDPYYLLRELKTKLTDHGLIVASIPNIRYYSMLKQLVVYGNWDYKDQGILDRTHLRFFTYKSIIKMFVQLNYTILQMEGIHPTPSRTYKILNLLLLNFISDVKYKHFVIVAGP